MDALVQFLRARLDEDEQTARGTLWDGSGNRPSWDLPASATVEVGTDTFYAGDSTVARHIARHDPARVLAEVDAKRQILRRLEGAEFTLGVAEKGTVPHELMTGAVNSWRDAVRLLALPYADHSDYRPEWAPDLA